MEIQQDEIDLRFGGEQAAGVGHARCMTQVDLGVLHRDQQGDGVPNERVVVDEQALHGRDSAPQTAIGRLADG